MEGTLAMPTAEARSPLPELPNDWLPDDALMFAVAKRFEDGTWETVLPSFAIVARGDTVDDAMHQASELLIDYFRLCARDGLTFEQAGRPIPRRWMAQLMAGVAYTSLRRTLHRRSRRGIRLLRVPARHALC